MKKVFTGLFCLFLGIVRSQNPALVLYDRAWYEENNIESVLCTTIRYSEKDTIQTVGPNFHYHKQNDLLLKVYVDAHGKKLKKLNQYFRINECNLPIEVNKKGTDTLSLVTHCNTTADAVYEQFGIFYKTNNLGQLIEKWTDLSQVNYYFESYEYNLNGKLNRIINKSSSSRSVSDYVYDETGRLICIETNSEQTNHKENSVSHLYYIGKTVELKTIIKKSS